MKVCEHCDHFVCLKCAEEHRTTTKVDTQDLTNKWQECKNKYSTLLQKLSKLFFCVLISYYWLWIDQYNRDRTQIESDLAAIRVAVEQRTRDTIQFVQEQRDSLVNHINEHIDQEQAINKY